MKILEELGINPLTDTLDKLAKVKNIPVNGLNEFYRLEEPVCVTVDDYCNHASTRTETARYEIASFDRREENWYPEEVHVEVEVCNGCGWHRREDDDCWEPSRDILINLKG